MKPEVIAILLVLLLAIGCEREEIVPQRPQESTAAPAHDSTSFKKPEQHTIDSATYQRGEFKSMPYRFLIPRGYDRNKQYPLHVFLHGISERGTDNERQLVTGATNFRADSVRAKYPAFIVFPQCPQSNFWFDNQVMDTLKALIDDFASTHAVNKNKISIGGFSMGAYGTFAMVAKYPGFFQAAVAISGEGNTNKAPLMVKPTWQIFAGKKDHVVPSTGSRKMALALEKAGASVTFTVFDDADHVKTSEEAFAQPDFFARLFDADHAHDKDVKR